jgi:hypothetical protein
MQGAYNVDSAEHGLAALRPDPSAADPHLERKHDTGVTIYGEDEVAERLAEVVETYPEMWTDRGTVVDIPEEDYMPLPVVHDWETKVPPPKMYNLGPRDRAAVDEMCDKLQTEGKMEFTTRPTPFGFPVFVVWKNGKARAVVDIRGLNKITVPDSYQIPLQSDLFSRLLGCQYITTVDCLSFFYQWGVKPEDRHKFTINTHRGQESFRVAVMGYCNSVQYVQRQLDNLLRPCRDFARAYIDDIVIFSKTLDDHVRHLHHVFSLLDTKKISVSPKKSFLGYPSTTLLGRRVDGLGLGTDAEKMEAVLNIRYPETL